MRNFSLKVDVLKNQTFVHSCSRHDTFCAAAQRLACLCNAPWTRVRKLCNVLGFIQTSPKNALRRQRKCQQHVLELTSVTEESAWLAVYDSAASEAGFDESLRKGGVEVAACGSGELSSKTRSNPEACSSSRPPSTLTTACWTFLLFSLSFLHRHGS